MIFNVKNSLVRQGILTLNPLDIATGGDKKVNISVEGEESLGQLLELDNLYQLIYRDLMLISTLIILFLFGTMHFIKKSEMLGEKKEAVLHVFKVIFFISSLLWILEVIVGILDFIF